MISNRLGWIGVDIGTHTIKLAQAERTPSGVRVRHAAVIQRAHPWSAEDSLALGDPLSSRDEIHAALECDAFRGRDAACLLPMNVCDLRGLNVPHGDEHERRAMIENELGDEWTNGPVPMEFDFWELGADGRPETADGFNVNVLCVSRPWVTQAAGDCQQSSLDCWAVDGGPLAMARAVGHVANTTSGQRVLAVDWGYSSATLCVVGHNRPLYARRIHECGLRRCLESVAGTIGVSLDHAQHLAQVHGVLPPGEHARDRNGLQTAVSESFAETIERLIEQIQRTMRFVDLQRKHLRPTSVWLMGGGASVRNIGPHLSAALELPVSIWSMGRESELDSAAAGGRAALFAGAFALSTLAWRAA